MKYIWVVETDDYTEPIRHIGTTLYYADRKSAEDYLRPLAEHAFPIMLGDIAYNKDSDYELILKLYKKRGLQEVRQEDTDELLTISDRKYGTVWRSEAQVDGYTYHYHNFGSVYRRELH
jgi:hypothetical protein